MESLNNRKPKRSSKLVLIEARVDLPTNGGCPYGGGLGLADYDVGGIGVLIYTAYQQRPIALDIFKPFIELSVEPRFFV